MKMLNKKAIFYIPYEDGNDMNLDKKKIKHIEDYVVDELIKLGGGATVLEGVGYWRDAAGVKKKMDTKVILSYLKNYDNILDRIEKIGNYIKNETNSKEVCYELNDVSYFM
ncbi:hypothetical protein [Anaeromicrobium sediminis]|uniref:Uncharacterized protein n=1 Tax=Anaeromicrobium sediminis TaxID=1478221 RepID=A0A267MPB1_9FIRM|nr:hypothetical protein [Anaeromicrobium sediminis]PAB60738.1 hypothetical protein CCE28_04155 [Anaeromicrobium sediminis]